MEKWFGAGDLV